MHDERKIPDGFYQGFLVIEVKNPYLKNRNLFAQIPFQTQWSKKIQSVHPVPG